MNILSTITRPRRCLPFLWAFLSLSAIVLVSCNDSSVDSDTARYVVGDGNDTTSHLPDLQKAYIEAGIVGEGGNTLVSDFVNFSRVTQYTVDVLPDGRIQGLRDLHLKATFGDPGNSGMRHNFYPLHELQFRIPELSVGAQGTTVGQAVKLEDDPDKGGRAGLKALFVHQGHAVTLVTSAGTTVGNGYVYISSVDPTQRTIGVHLEADLTNPLPRTTPNRVVDRLVVRVDLQLPY